ncbi:peptidase associated/transthyretin-like domain-containing protein [Verminephrobacter eiseniae]|uniref:hypothetical protein n=1 Tax=Verminephrobacter eiseniae TaxID=364317 RepID=UPI002242EDF8|nr:hypothetical protein [Verminephrobacter eiseniae]
MFRAGDAHPDSDPVFGVRPSRVAQWLAQADGSRPPRLDLVLNPSANQAPPV